VKVKLNQEILYVDKIDISNFEWAVYVAFIHQNDSAVQRQIIERIIVLHDNKQLHDAPVLGISREQAEAYCQWRTDMVNQHPRFEKAKKTVCYTLLTEEQCRLLAQKKRWRKLQSASQTPTENGFRCIATMKIRSK
jgi:formylglycine-generating enzyme required for sulfatase activity